MGWRIGGGRGGKRSGKAFGLDVTSAADTFADGGRAFAHTHLEQFLFGKTGHFDVEVNAVEEGTGDAFLVLGNGGRGTDALSEDIAVVAAGAGVHRGDQPEIGSSLSSKMRRRGLCMEFSVELVISK